MRKGFVLCVVALAATFVPALAGAVNPTSDLDIAGAELAGSAGGASINVFGTLRCQAAGPLTIDVTVTQASTGGVAAGGNNGLACPEPGALVKWVVTAQGAGFVVGDKVTIEAVSAGATAATDVEDHVLRWGR